MRKVLLMLGVMLLAGCASKPVSLSEDQIKSLDRVAVVSVAGNRLIRKHVGLTIFTNKETSMDIREWKLDRYYEDQISAAVKDIAQLEVAPARVDGSALLHVYDLTGPWDAPVFRKPNWDKVAPTLRDIATQNDLDGIFLLVRSESSDSIGARTYEFLNGLGIYSHFGNQTAYLYAALYFIDGESGRPAANTEVTKGYESINRPDVSLPEGVYDKPMEQMTEPEREQLREIFLGLFGDDVTQATVARLMGATEQQVSKR